MKREYIAKLRFANYQMRLDTANYHKSPGVEALPEQEREVIFRKISDTDSFAEEGKSLFGEHGSGWIAHNGQEFFWKIDYIEVQPAEFERVLIVFLAEEIKNPPPG